MSSSNCGDLLFIQEEHAGAFLFGWILAVVIVFAMTFFVIHHLFYSWKEKFNPRQVLKFSCVIVSLFYLVVMWLNPLFILLLIIELFASSERIDDIESECNLNVSKTFGVVGSITPVIHGIALQITFFIYFLRLKICFGKTAYSIGKCVSVFSYGTLMYVCVCCVLKKQSG